MHILSKIKKLKTSALFIVAVLAFLILNALVSFISLKADFSAGKAYTLSSSTQNILRNLKKPVTITVFISSDLPTQLLPLKADVLDLLREYAKSSHNVDLRIVDPKKDEKMMVQAQEMGIPELQFSQVEQDKYAVSTAFFGIGLVYGDKRESIPQVTDVGNLEFNVTSAIYKMARKNVAKVGLAGLEGAAALGGPDPISVLHQVASRQFAFEPIAYTESVQPIIDASYSALMLVDMGDKIYSESEKEALFNYLKHGGKAIFFLDGVTVSDTLTTQEAQHGLSGLLRRFGIEIKPDLVLSESAELVNFGNESVQILTPYPFWIRATDFNNKTSYFSNVQTLTYPWVSSLSVDAKNTSVTALVYSPQHSWEQREPFELNPQAISPPQESALKQYLLTAEVNTGNNGKLIVVPSSRFIQDRYLGRTSGNIPFVLNILSDLVSGGALSGILSRGVNFYPLPEMTATQKDLFRYGNIFLLPVLFGFYGLYRLLRRR